MNFDTAILGPMAAHAALVFGLYVLLMIRRRFSLTDKAAVKQYRDQGIEPLASALVNKNIANQFELPVLFHVACIVIYLIDADNIVTLSLAWAFVATRYIHSYVHVTSNQLRYRAPAFAIGLLFVLILWIWITAFLLLS
jgi:hypothetical protein